MMTYRNMFRNVMLSAALGTSLTAQAYAADAEAMAIGRCDIPSSTSLFTRISGGLPASWQVHPSTASHGSALPDLMVDGWPARKAPADILLQELLLEAGLQFENSGALSEVSWDGRVASLTDVVDDLVGQAGGFWSFDGTTLSVSSSAPVGPSTATLMLPQNRDVRLATIDILRAFDIDVVIDQSEIRLSGPDEELKKARAALSEADRIMVLDVIFLRGRPTAGRYDWTSLGATRAVPAGAGGQFVFTDPEPETLIQRLAGVGDLIEDSAQSVAAPEGWGLAVPPSQCGLGNGEIVVMSKKNEDKIDLSVEGSALDADFAGFVLGSTAASVSEQPVDGWIRMVVVRPRMVTFSPD